VRLLAGRRRDDLPAERGALLDDLADVRGPDELAVVIDGDGAFDALEAEARERRLDLRGVDALGLLDGLEEQLRRDVVVGDDVVGVAAVGLLVALDERLVLRVVRAHVVAEVVVEADDLIAERLEQRLGDHVHAEDGLVLVEQLELVALVDERHAVGAVLDREQPVGVGALELRDVRAELSRPQRRERLEHDLLAGLLGRGLELLGRRVTGAVVDRLDCPLLGRQLAQRRSDRVDVHRVALDRAEGVGAAPLARQRVVLAERVEVQRTERGQLRL
jgi:hypothetical protein